MRDVRTLYPVELGVDEEETLEVRDDAPTPLTSSAGASETSNATLQSVRGADDILPYDGNESSVNNEMRASRYEPQVYQQEPGNGEEHVMDPKVHVTQDVQSDNLVYASSAGTDAICAEPAQPSDPPQIAAEYQFANAKSGKRITPFLRC